MIDDWCMNDETETILLASYSCHQALFFHSKKRTLDRRLVTQAVSKIKTKTPKKNIQKNLLGLHNHSHDPSIRFCWWNKTHAGKFLDKYFNFLVLRLLFFFLLVGWFVSSRFSFFLSTFIMLLIMLFLLFLHFIVQP